jgi:hypothetical protein
VKYVCDTRGLTIIKLNPIGGYSSLDIFDLIYFSFGVGRPTSGTIFKLGSDKRLVSNRPYGLGLNFMFLRRNPKVWFAFLDVL